MILRLFAAITLTFLCGLLAFASDDHPRPDRLGGAGVSWNDNRLTVRLKDAPVKKVLEELMESEGGGCQVTGDLQGTISMAIHNLTVPQTIHRIMRNRRLDYTMILGSPGLPDGIHAFVSELAIYQGDTVVRFVRVADHGLAARPKRVEPRPAPVRQRPEKSPVPAAAATEGKNEDIESEIKSIMDEMLADEKMSKPEYDEVMQTFSGEKASASP